MLPYYFIIFCQMQKIYSIVSVEVSGSAGVLGSVEVLGSVGVLGSVEVSGSAEVLGSI